VSTEQAMYAATVADVDEPDSVLLPGHDVPLGRYTTVRRLLPHRQRRMIGAWCFVDHFGPDDVTGRPGMQVPPHPHTGLQTVTWLVDGIIEHRDSLGSHQMITPGQLNLMTSGHGIAHSEYTPPDHPADMHGLQLWVALPSPLLGAELVYAGPASHELPADPSFEYGMLAMTGAATVAGTTLQPGSLLYLGAGRDEITVQAPGPARLFLLGGAPFEEPLVMWWNFVGRSHQDILQAREEWMGGRRFGTVPGCAADPLPAPAMPTVTLKARDRHGHMK
jgi:redox-sensitive bicupin YhaK (pirin superfamily)